MALGCASQGSCDNKLLQDHVTFMLLPHIEASSRGATAWHNTMLGYMFSVHSSLCWGHVAA